MESSEVREPIPYGLVKLVGFIVLVAVATYLAWVFAHPAWAAVVFVGLFAAVRLVHPHGWTDWIREFWFWNVRGVRPIPLRVMFSVWWNLKDGRIVGFYPSPFTMGRQEGVSLANRDETSPNPPL